MVYGHYESSAFEVYTLDIVLYVLPIVLCRWYQYCLIRCTSTMLCLMNSTPLIRSTDFSSHNTATYFKFDVQVHLLIHARLLINKCCTLVR
jgi:hypothetical protein